MLLRQGVLGIKVQIMFPWDPSAKSGPKKPLPDRVSIVEPQNEILPTTPILEQKGGNSEPPAMPQHNGLLGSWIWSLEDALKTFNKIFLKDFKKTPQHCVKRFSCLMPLKRLNKIPAFTDKEIESGDTATALGSCQPRITVGSDPVQGCTRKKATTRPTSRH